MLLSSERKHLKSTLESLQQARKNQGNYKDLPNKQKTLQMIDAEIKRIKTKLEE